MTTSNHYKYVEFVGGVANELADVMEQNDIEAICIDAEVCRLSSADYDLLKEIAPAAFDGGDIVDVDIYEHICGQNADLAQVETTSEASGYPRGLGRAVVGFDTFEEARQVADKYGLTVVKLHKRDGWQLWYNDRRELDDSDRPTLAPEDMGYSTMYQAGDEERVVEDLKAAITGLDDIECIVNLAQSRQDIIEELDALGDDEAIFTDHDSKTPTEWEKVNIHPTEWQYDTHHCIIAVC